MVSWLMVNFDGAYKGNPIPIEARGIVRDHLGRIVMMIVEPLGQQTQHYAKAQVAYICLTSIPKLECSNLIMVGDSLNIFNILKGISIPN